MCVFINETTNIHWIKCVEETNNIGLFDFTSSTPNTL